MDAIFDTVCVPSPSGCDVIGGYIGVVLTVLVLSFLFRDQVLFRLAQSLLVGTAIGFGSAVILHTVLWAQLLKPIMDDFGPNSLPLVLILLLGLLLLLKLTPWSSSFWSNMPLGILFGVGAALAIGGALNSALSQQVIETLQAFPGKDSLSWVNAVIILVGTIGALLSFRFTTQENNAVMRLYSRIAGAWGRVGVGFIMIAFGAILANVLIARIATLVGQLYFVLNTFGIK